MPQLLVESGGKMRAEAQTTVPNCGDLAQIKLTVFISKRQTFLARPAVITGEPHVCRTEIRVETDRVAAVSRDGLGHSRDAFVIVAVRDDENRHEFYLQLALPQSPLKSEDRDRVPTCPIHRRD